MAVGPSLGLANALPATVRWYARSASCRASSALPNLMYATGHYRNGVLLAPVTAQLVADAMLDNRIDPLLGPVSPSRFGNL